MSNIRESNERLVITTNGGSLVTRLKCQKCEKALLVHLPDQIVKFKQVFTRVCLVMFKWLIAAGSRVTFQFSLLT